ncbi:UNVERIFIED_ORG: NAD(P)-dependent dehydrogenase (short-subunit alcohol dehydrogenase family) [Rhizobium sophorae]|nr:NAD(P)-dependent dehydrogenase (short-subunit alcohol dehydrogenase family) [Rhizobium leguminosarum]MDH6662719.1 NAD(P)-dependent dehydrogenase (short-subunit alcohol dehydrogenase family) [Rhizobium sophorae]
MAHSIGFTEASVPDQTGKTFIVTGANAGIGFEISQVLAARGARVLLACRERARAEQAIARIRHITPKADLAWLPLDLGDLDNVRAAAEIAAREPRIDVLINNAGIMNPPLTRTEQGFESQFGVNHLGVFGLTTLLLPKLAETPGSRVVVTSSIAHLKGRIDWDDLNAEKSYNKNGRYGGSKLANALFFSSWIGAYGRQILQLRLSGAIRALRVPVLGGTWGSSNSRVRSSVCSSTARLRGPGLRCRRRQTR